jgi:hypothetical protein
MPFFRKENQNLISTPHVEGNGYCLSEGSKDEYTYPFEGWYYFTDLDAAIAGFAAPAAGGISVTMRQARLALLQAGLLDTVNNTIATLGSPDAQAIQIEWEYASEVRKQSPLVVGLGAMLGLTELQIDQLFEIAATL